MKTSNEIIKSGLASEVLEALNTSPVEIPEHVKRAIVSTVVRGAAPIVLNQTNNERWYLSRVTWGALLSAIGATSALFGYPLAEELQSRILEVITLWTAFGGLIAGPALTVYGRWIAVKPIGE